MVFAHRGCSSLAPENTFAAFRKARDLGIPGIELDIHVCATGQLVVAHDHSFRRVAGDDRIIEELSLEEIRAIDAGSWFDPAFRGERPPLLEEVLEEFCPAMYVDIELKTRRTRGDPLPEAAARTLQALGPRVKDAVAVSSFNPLSLAAFKKHCPGIPTAIIWSADTSVPLPLRWGAGRFIAPCDYLKPVYRQVNRLTLFGFTLEGYPVVPWTIDDPALAERMLRIGCAGIISNRPQDIAGREEDLARKQ
ncbi:MAG: glycerophosphodiester phosphodiesterase [Spirochaetaceae bacterium]|jgi:glycerophosphoryl diester phosphodiesterase|nr:glycerophosphodiester phosphodiesterase [Spirochaetaceae bacterium]